MLLDARISEVDLDREAEFAIIGGGVAGITLARRLGQRHEVVLVESGGEELDAATQALYDGEAIGLNYSLTGSRLRYLGGSSNHWGGWCSPLDPEDFEARDWVEHSGWPIDYADYAAWLGPAADLLDLGGSSFDVAEFAASDDGAQRLSEGDFRQRLYRFSQPVTRFGSKYRSELERSDTIRVLLNANVTDLVPDPERPHLAGLQLRTLNGRSGIVRARHYVLACGGIENARILLAANRHHNDRIGNRHGRVGRFFMEHPHIGLAEFVSNDLHWCDAQRALRRDGEHWVGLAVTLNAKSLAARRCLNFSGHLFGRECDPEATMMLWAMTAQAPNPDSRVLLGDTADALGLPRAHLDWRLSDLDWQSIHTAAGLLGRHFGRLGLGRVRFPVGLRDRDPSAIGYGSHHMGTTRMSADPAQGVVDANCRVHDVDNLHIAGSSVFSTSGCVNPTLSLTALALRLGDHLDRVAAR
jgi:choline dehydrogenase-like flavoprotein